MENRFQVSKRQIVNGFTVNTKCSLVVNFDSFPSNHQISQWNLKTSHAQNDRQLYSPFRGKMDKACVGNFLLCLLKAYLSTTRWSVSNKATVCLKFSLRWVFLKLLLNESHNFFFFQRDPCVWAGNKRGSCARTDKILPKCLRQKNKLPLCSFKQDGC